MRRFIFPIVLVCALFSQTGICQEIDWQNDLAVLASELKAKHPDPFTVITEEEFDSKVEALSKTISELNRLDATFELMELVASIGDGHTSVVPDRQAFRFFPINVRWFEDGVYVRAIDQRHREMVGAKLVSIGDMPIDEVVEGFSKFLSHDNVWGVRKLIDKQIQTVEYLARVGALDDSETATFHFEKGGESIAVEMKAVAAENANGIRFVNAYAAGLMKEGIFLDLLVKDERGLPFWNEWIADQKVVYFKYNECRDPEGFASLVEGTAAFIERNDVEKFVLDLRDNVGGSSLVFKPLLEYLVENEQLNREGKLFVIVGRDTFSSGIFAACDMRQTNAIFVGEPTGAKPNHFGEVSTFELPGSGLTVQHSTKSFHLVDGDPETFEPDILIRFDAENSFAAHDQALQAIFDYEE